MCGLNIQLHGLTQLDDCQLKQREFGAWDDEQGDVAAGGNAVPEGSG
jgi:hypothetical protein